MTRTPFYPTSDFVYNCETENQTHIVVRFIPEDAGRPEMLLMCCQAVLAFFVNSILG